TFHSLEDRIVKQFMLQRSNKNAAPSRHSPASLLVQQNDIPNLFDLTPTKAITPREQEVSLNPRARSAKLRCATRTASPTHAAA
ncbi:MAG: 16S rRNA (cytosine(1402)-N(4))-methyltransferase, partial [Rickettsiales bacterium]|nr:16S rRNA (cytosine(1402)-N(4))-methyltransferase [Rickettsiales bacterium]